jgi:hypothetical protein
MATTKTKTAGNRKSNRPAKRKAKSDNSRELLDALKKTTDLLKQVEAAL